EQQLGLTNEASRRFERALALRRRLGDLDGILSTLTNLGRLHQQQGALVKSASLFQEAAGRALRYAQPVLLGRSLLFLGRVYDQQMNTRLAASTLQRAVSASLRASVPTVATLAAWELAPVAAALGDVDLACQMLEVSARAARSQLTAYARSTHHYVSGLVALHVGDDRRARVSFERALRHPMGLYEWRRHALSHL
ncbi:MAG: tetratricopeptide repeat protein, partial [Planctomycetota bacterium]|nr:tetratricopeptide repeat protein [Planctomycetota bacterium]